MRRIAPFLVMLAVAGCGPAMRWDKAGATDETAAADMTSCRQAAMQEANRYYPFGYYPSGFGTLGWGWGLYRSNWSLWQIRQDNDRFYAENRLTAFCMRTKGYEQVPVQQAPQTQAPHPPPASPEPPLPK
jgi:hypothetical protein